ncbi:MAG: hypothetical protein A2Z20_07975 [Bdellovibrionales bacterium RBG_16_40_8]|nr:MAG: hypothetical protein A2Z20_07975 [Bdellovibrionales bacterium RBG_16_40_8]
MEGLAPPLHLCIEVRMMMERGESINSGLRKIIPEIEINFRQHVIKLLFEFDQYGKVNHKNFASLTMYRRELLNLLVHGLCGEPILPRIIGLEHEIKTACLDEIQTYVNDLPLRGLLTMLLIQFPAFLLLLFGPLINELTRSFMQ